MMKCFFLPTSVATFNKFGNSSIWCISGGKVTYYTIFIGQFGDIYQTGGGEFIFLDLKIPVVHVIGIFPFVSYSLSFKMID